MDMSSGVIIVYPGDVNTLIKEGPLFVKSFVYSNYTDSEHRCIITDRDGNDIFNQRGNLEYEEVTVEPSCVPFWETFVSKLDSGQLYIYVR